MAAVSARSGSIVTINSSLYAAAMTPLSAQRSSSILSPQSARRGSTVGTSGIQACGSATPRGALGTGGRGNMGPNGVLPTLLPRAVVANPFNFGIVEKGSMPTLPPLNNVFSGFTSISGQLNSVQGADKSVGLETELITKRRHLRHSSVTIIDPAMAAAINIMPQ